MMRFPDADEPMGGDGAPGGLIRVVRPDMPTALELLPLLQRIEQTNHYSNFGPLERELRSQIGAWIDPADPPHVVTFSSGTEALTTALRTLGLPPGARVLTAALTFPATVYAIQAAGLTPVLSDVDPIQWRLTPELAERCRGGFDAVVPVATFGAPMSVKAWDDFGEATGAPVVIDGAAALLHRLRPRRCTVVFSLHATKPLGIGEGGLMLTPDGRRAELARRFSNFGLEEGQVATPSGNGKMSEYHAAVALAQLGRAAQIRARFDTVLGWYDELLPPLRRLSGLPANLVVEAGDGAEDLAQHLAEAGVETRRWYHPNVARQPAFRECPRAGTLEVCDHLGERLLGLPFHTALTRRDVERVSQAVGEAARQAADMVDA